MRASAVWLALLCLLPVPAGAVGPDPSSSMLPPAETRMLVLRGDPARPVNLKVRLFLPPGAGPFPLVVWNHGSDGRGADQDMHNVGTHYGTYYFLARGYAVAHPLLRGYGGSGGRIQVSGCDMESLGRQDARDIAAVIAQLEQQPQISGQRVLVAGGSFGGWNTLAVGALNDPHVAGLVNFYGGVRTSNCSASDAALVSGARDFGRVTRIPSLWLYGDNDRLFPRATWQAMYTAYRAEGGPAELVPFGTFMSNSHKLLSYPQGIAVVSPRLDGFLSRLGLPTWVLYPQYMPSSQPRRTQFAAVDDVAAVPYLSEQGREAYRAFLSRPFPRAAVLAPGGVLASANGGFDPLARALAICQRYSRQCRPYAVDGDVVWRATALPKQAHLRSRTVPAPAQP